MQQRVRMPLVDEAFSPTAVGEFTASQGDPLQVERRAEDKPAGRALQVRHQGRLGQIPLGATKLAAFPVVRASGGDHGKDLAHPGEVPVAQREPEHPVMHPVPRFGLHRGVHVLRGRLPWEQEQEQDCGRDDGVGSRHGSVCVHGYLAVGVNIREKRPGRALPRLRCDGEVVVDRDAPVDDGEALLDEAVGAECDSGERPDFSRTQGFDRGEGADQHHRALSALGILVLMGVGGFAGRRLRRWVVVQSSLVVRHDGFGRLRER